MSEADDKLRAALEECLALETEKAKYRGLSDCCCVSWSRDTERNYENGECPHQKARQALATPTDQPGDGAEDVRRAEEIRARLAAEPCRTHGLEDLEPGCCAPCRARAALTSTAVVPDGMVMVPREPTRDMIIAGGRVRFEPEGTTTTGDIYRAMLSAVPSLDGGR